jgi:hypothetical protein
MINKQTNIYSPLLYADGNGGQQVHNDNAVVYPDTLPGTRGIVINK